MTSFVAHLALRAAGMLSSYATSKVALLHLGSVMALELAGKGIRVNTICPGNIETDMQESLADYEQTLIKRTPLRSAGIPASRAARASAACAAFACSRRWRGQSRAGLEPDVRMAPSPYE